MAGKRRCPPGEIWTESFGCIEPVKEDDGITLEQLDAILAEEKKEQAKITTGLPAHSRKKKRSRPRKKKSVLETGVREAVQEAIISTKL